MTLEFLDRNIGIQGGNITLSALGFGLHDIDIKVRTIYLNIFRNNIDDIVLDLLKYFG